jgi:uncharacterized repeat protein (TIGR02059 family)
MDDAGGKYELLEHDGAELLRAVRDAMIGDPMKTLLAFTLAALLGVGPAAAQIVPGGSPITTLPVTIPQGGCGATTASGCRANIGAAASGANTDISSLGSLNSIRMVGPKAGVGFQYFGLDPGVTAGSYNFNDIQTPVTSRIGDGITQSTGFVSPLQTNLFPGMGTNFLQSSVGLPAPSVNNAVVVLDTPTVPVLSTSIIDLATPNTLVLTYPEALNTTAPATSVFTLTTSVSTAVSVSSVAISGSSVTLTLSRSLLWGEVVKVSYVAPGTNPIQAVGGGLAASFSAQAVSILWNSSPAVASSTLTSGTSALAVNYSTALGSVMPAASAFTVSASGGAVTVSSVSIAGSVLTMSLSRTIGSGETVTWSYLAPGYDGFEAEAFGAGVVPSGPLSTRSDLVAINAGVSVSYPTNSDTYGGSIGNTVNTNGVVRGQFGYEPDMFTYTSTGVQSRVAFHALGAGTGTGTVSDAAFAVVCGGGGGNINGCFTDLLLLQDQGGTLNHPISPTGNLINVEGDRAYTINDGFRLKNVTFSGSFADLSNAIFNSPVINLSNATLGSQTILLSPGIVIGHNYTLQNYTELYGTPAASGVTNGHVQLGNQVTSLNQNCGGAPSCYVFTQGGASATTTYSVPAYAKNANGSGGTANLVGTGAGASAIQITLDGLAAGSGNILNIVGANVSESISVDIHLQKQGAGGAISESWFNWTMELTNDAFSVTTLTSSTAPVATFNISTIVSTLSATVDSTNHGATITVTPPSGGTWTATGNARYLIAK